MTPVRIEDILKESRIYFQKYYIPSRDIVMRHFAQLIVFKAL